MPVFDHVTPEHARRLARANVIGAIVMLALLGGCFAFGLSGDGSAEGPANERPMAIVVGLVVLVPYGIFLLVAAGLLRRWPRTGYVAHILAWNWPFILAIGAAVSAWLLG
jgi:hypothetical protein